MQNEQEPFKRDWVSDNLFLLNL